ncbi:MAG: sensor histidine kinase [Chloroflexi bacterium]|nr:sensor histidine kinase [Chloroflexota bacterium]
MSKVGQAQELRRRESQASGQQSGVFFVSRGLLSRRRVHLCLLVVIVALGTLLHYGDWLPVLADAAARTPIPLTNRQSLERILLLLPIIYASVVFGRSGGLTVLGIATAIMVPRALMGPGDLVQALLQVAGVSVTGVLFLSLVVSERRRVDDARAMTQRIIMAQEEERQRTARGLHDDTAQSLYLLSQRLDRLASGKGGQVDAEAAAELRDVRELAVRTGEELRRILWDLRPRILDDMGLLPALEWLVDEVHRYHGIRGKVEVRGPLPPLSAQAQLIIWRIAQEAMHNVVKHAEATEVGISVARGHRSLKLRVWDNGKGFDARRLMRHLPRQTKLGLLGMQERARLLGGTLTVHSEPGKGTSVSVELPLTRDYERGRSVAAAPPAP